MSPRKPPALIVEAIHQALDWAIVHTKNAWSLATIDPPETGQAWRQIDEARASLAKAQSLLCDLADVARDPAAPEIDLSDFER